MGGSHNNSGLIRAGKFFLVSLVIFGLVFPGGIRFENLIHIPEAQAAAGEVILLWDGATIPTGWTCISCATSDAFYGVFPRASSTYGNATSGADTVTHNFTYSSQSTAAAASQDSDTATATVPPYNHAHTWSAPSIGSTSQLPPYKHLKLIRAATTTLPNGTIGIFDVTATSSLPTNWTYYSAMDGNYLRGASSTGTGGSATHTHTVGGVTSGAANNTLRDSANGASVGGVSHTHALSATSTVAASNTPAFVTVVFAQLGTTSTLPDGLIAMFDDTSLPTDWSIISGSTSTYSGKLLKGSNSFANASGSTSTHDHGGSQTLTSDGPSATRAIGDNNGGTTFSTNNHTHDIAYTISSESNLPVFRDVILGKYSLSGIAESSYRWYSNTDSVELGAVRSNPTSTAGNEIAYDIQLSTSTGFFYTVGNELSTLDWRIEKRSMTDGSLVYATTTVAANTDVARAIALDSTSMYVAGDYNGVFGTAAWRLEKRSLSDGAVDYATTTAAGAWFGSVLDIKLDTASNTLYLGGPYSYDGGLDVSWQIQKLNTADASRVTAFGTNGEASSSPSVKNDFLNALALDTASGSLYAVGSYSHGAASTTGWRIEKRDSTTASLTYATSSALSTSSASDVGFDSTHLYIGGYETIAGDAYWRIEKRLKSDGSLVSATTTNPSASDDQITSLVVDAANGVMYLSGYDTGGSGTRWRMEKRSLSDLSLTYAVTSDPSSNGDIANAIALDTTNSAFYAAGYDTTPGNLEWRMEKRGTSDGSTAWGSPLAAANASATAPLQGTAFRLRALVHATSGLAVGAVSFKLQFAERSGTCDTSFSGETYSDVATSSGAIRFYNNTSTADGDVIATSTADPTHGSDVIVPQSIEEQNNFAVTSTISSGRDGLWDFALVDSSASEAAAYCFRIVQSDGSTLNTYERLPEITTFTSQQHQSAYRWYSNTDSRELQAVVKNHSAADDVARDIALDVGSGYMYAVGQSNASGSEWSIEKRSMNDGSLSYATTSELGAGSDDAFAVAIDNTSMYVGGQNARAGGWDWRIEKRSFTAGSLSVATQTSAGVTGAVSAVNDIAIDASNSVMYVGGYDYTPGTMEWRIEKRNTGDLSFVSAFGTGGVATSDPSVADDDYINAIKIDTSGGFLYAGGYQGSSTESLWRIEKRSLTTGALSLATTTNPSTGTDEIYDIALDTSGGYLYAIGYQASSSEYLWRIEKRNISDLSLVYATTTNPSTGTDLLRSIGIDVSGGYMYLAGYDSGGTATTTRWRMERRSLSDGSLSYATTTDPSPGDDDAANAIAVDTASGNMYVAGYDSFLGNAEWRIEKRALSDGSPRFGTALAAQDTSAVAPGQGTAFRLRMLIHSTGTLAVSGRTLKLQMAVQSGTCDTAFSGETYADVATSSGAIRFYNNTSTADGDVIATSTADPTHGSDTVKPQTYEEENNFTNATSAIGNGQDGLWDFALVDSSAASSTTYCFRAINSSGAVIDSYGVIPAITTGGTLNLSSYRWYSNTDSPELGAIRSNPSSTTDVATAIAADTGTGHFYAVGYDGSPGNNEVRIEKRLTSDGSLVYATSSDKSSNDDEAHAVALDSSAMYVAGIWNALFIQANWFIEKRSLSDGSLVYSTSTPALLSSVGDIEVDTSSSVMYVGGVFSSDWRIEKRNTSDASFVTAFDTDGIVSSTPSGSTDTLHALALDTASSSLYAVGNMKGSTSTLWWIEKYNSTTGALTYATSSALSTSSASDVGFDSTHLYIGGYETIAGDAYWRIEKRLKSDGSLVSATTTNPSASDDQITSLVVDAANGVMYLSGYDTGGSGTRWRMEKRSLSDLSLTYAVTSDPSTSTDTANGLAVDVSGGAMYVAGHDYSPGNFEWRMEKRGTTNGALVSNPLAALSTATSSPDEDTPFRLRTLIHNSGSDISANGLQLKLQYAEKSSSCDASFSGESYSDVATSTGVIRYYNNTISSDATTLTASSTNDPTHGSDVVILQSYEESNTSTNPAALTSGKDGMWDFALVDDSAPSSTSYCFRLIKSNGDFFDNYSVIPEIQSQALPGAPGTPTFSDIATSTFTVSWTAATGADYYRVERSAVSPEIYFQVATTSALSAAQVGLAASTTYLYRIGATNEKGNGPYGSTSSVRTLSGYAPSGTLQSLIIDTAVTNGVAPNSLYWEGSMPASTSVKFQFAAATSSDGPWSYVAWNNSTNTCDANSYYAPSAPDEPVEVKAVCHQNRRYIRYKVLLESYATTTTPTVQRVILNYAQ